MTALAAVDLAIGIVLLATGGAAWWRRADSRVGPLLVLTGVAWFAGYLSSELAFLHRGPLVQVLLSYPTGRVRGWLARGTVLLAYAAALTDAFHASPFLQIGLAGLVAISAMRVFGAARRAARAAARPALLVAFAFMGVLVVGGLNQAAGWRFDTVVLLVYDAVVALVAVVLMTDLFRGRWTQAALADLVTTVGQDVGTGLEAGLRHALGDDSLRVGYWDDERRTYLDETGSVVAGSEADRAVTVIDDNGPLAKLFHDPELLRDPAWVEGAVSVIRLAIRNARMHAEIESALDELRDSRRRIIAAGEDQQRGVLDVLAAGPLNQLTKAEHLVAACDELDGERNRLLTELTAVRADLDSLVRGILPPALAAGGLPVALRHLADRSATPVHVTVRAQRLPSETEAAIYFCCAEALTNIGRHARATKATVEVTSDRDSVQLIVEDDGVGGADPSGSGLRGLADRVEVLDGTLRFDSPLEGGTRLTVRIPLHGKDPS
ncbi:ATP-binding protein [Kribbella sp. NPDC006257]|uniref:sensor histidine kinase n=1 Tax=Kribbella sp. NPDC006257 TaxID=3156738 RepID=UPI0033A8C0B2